VNRLDRYALFGNVRMIKDFYYVFNKLNIILFIPNEEEKNIDALDKMGVPVRGREDLIKYAVDTVVICMKPNKKRDECISDILCQLNGGQTRIILCEDFFKLYDNSEIIKNVQKKIYVWGTGSIASLFLSKLTTDLGDYSFIDSFKKGDTFYGHSVKKPEEINDWMNVFVIIAVSDDRDIEGVLKAHGLKEGKDFIRFEDILWNPYEMLKKTFFSSDGYDVACDTMLNHLEISVDGRTRICCLAFLEVNRANFLKDDFMDRWIGEKSIIHRILAVSTQNRTYSFCNKKMCPLFDGRENIGCDDYRVINSEYHDIEPFPKVLSCGFDSSCNIACVTCRNKVDFWTGEKRKKADEIAEKITNELLPHIDFLIMSGNGEVFFSPSYRKIWEHENTNGIKFIRILSNGGLFTPDNWALMKDNKKNTKFILTVSIDAASKEVYDSIRKFGDFDQLKKNMIFAGKLRKKGELSYFRINFVVQRKNMYEMLRFIEFGKHIGADKVFFTKILNWGTYEVEDFENNISVMEKDGITPIPELKKILESREMKDEIVDLGTIRYLHENNKYDYIKNYYMWELEKDVEGLFQSV